MSLLHLFKLLRLQKVFQLLEPRQFNNLIKQYYSAKLKRTLQSFEDTGRFTNPTREDHNYIMRQIIISYAFRVLRLVIIIFSISYFIGTLWYIFTWLIYQYSDERNLNGLCFFTNIYGAFGSFEENRNKNEDFKS
jgi:hypothetical protein